MGKTWGLAVSGLLAIAGILLLLNSPTLGMAAANSWLRSIGGSSDGARFQAMLTAFSDAYRVLGAVLLGGGIFGAFQHSRNA